MSQITNKIEVYVDGEFLSKCREEHLDSIIDEIEIQYEEFDIDVDYSSFNEGRIDIITRGPMRLHVKNDGRWWICLGNPDYDQAHGDFIAAGYEGDQLSELLKDAYNTFEEFSEELYQKLLGEVVGLPTM